MLQDVQHCEKCAKLEKGKIYFGKKSEDGLGNFSQFETVVRGQKAIVDLWDKRTYVEVK